MARSLETAWREFVAFADSREFLAATGGPSDEDPTASSTVLRLSTSLGILTDQLAAQELQQAQESKEEAERTYAHSLSVLRTIVALALIAGVGVTIWLIRSVVVRVKEYSGFATRVAAGELNTRTRPRGHDELTDLGWSLNEMVARGERVRGYEIDTGRVHRRHAGQRDGRRVVRLAQASHRTIDPPEHRRGAQPQQQRGPAGGDHGVASRVRARREARDRAASRLSRGPTGSAARRGAGRRTVDQLRCVSGARRTESCNPCWWGGR